MRQILGIDPGQAGALAWVARDGRLLEIEDMPLTDGSVNAAMLASLIVAYDRLECAVVERVHSMPKQGVASSFKFGVSYGIVLGVLGALQVPTYHIAPNDWKRTLKLGKEKEQSRRMAIDRWPGEVQRFALKKHADRAEAALIAVAWLTQNGHPEPRTRVIPVAKRADTVD